MSKATHTPGPWEAVGSRIRTAGTGSFRRIATMEGGAFNVNVTDEANARLIAAAPDLLAALEAIEAHLTLHPGSSVANRAEARQVCEQARAAIAKARGA